MQLCHIQTHPQGDPASEPWLEGEPAVFEFFRAHPELMDPDLAKLINLDYWSKILICAAA